MTRAAAAVLGLLLALPVTASSFVTFESGQVRPLALSPDGTPALRRQHARTTGSRSSTSRAGGLDARRRRCRSASSRSRSRRAATREVWVVNHLSDSVSIVDVGATPPRVVRTLLVGDEPRDIVFAGPGGNRAFITTAHRGQNRPRRPAAHDRRASAAPTSGCSTRPTSARRSAARRSPSSTLFGDTPRALAAQPDGNTVYAAVFHSGNQTTTHHRGRWSATAARRRRRAASAARTCPGGLPAPNTNVQGIAGARDRPDRQVQPGDRPLGGRARPQLEQRACASTCPTRTCSRSTPTPPRRRRRAASPASARCSSTWPSTR